MMYERMITHAPHVIFLFAQTSSRSPTVVPASSSCAETDPFFGEPRPARWLTAMSYAVHNARAGLTC